MAVARGLAVVKLMTPNLASFATPYSSGDVLGSVLEIKNAVAGGGCCAILESLVVIDLANQKSAIDIVFFTDNPANSIGADNAAYALNDADASKIAGRFSVAAADYVSSSTTNAEATERAIGLLLQAGPVTPLAGAQNKNTSLFMAVISRGTPTYGSASDLMIKVGLLQE